MRIPNKKVYLNLDLRKPLYTKNSEYETSFEEISVPFNKNNQDTKTKIESAQLER